MIYHFKKEDFVQNGLSLGVGIEQLAQAANGMI